MAGQGVSYQDLLPVPTDVPAATDSGKHEVSHALGQEPTASHALAVADHDEKGHAQLDHDAPEVKDLGWNEADDKIANPLVGGLHNEELWVLIRRFNKVDTDQVRSPEVY